MTKLRDPRCRVCGSERSVVLTRGLTEFYFPRASHCAVRCSCGLVRTDPFRAEGAPPPAAVPRSRPRTRDRLRRVFLVGGAWWERLALYLPWCLFRLRLKHKLWCKRCYERPFRRRGVLVDVGCAAASRFAGWIPQHRRVLGVETDPALANAARRAGYEVHPGSLDDLRLPDGFADVVTMSHVLEHVEEPDRLLREARRIARDDGELLVWVPNRRSLFRAWFGRDWFPWGIPGHLWHFDARSLSDLLARCGWRVVEVVPDPTEAAFRKSARRAGGLLGCRFVRILSTLAAYFFRRTDAIRLRAVKATPAPAP